MCFLEFHAKTSRKGAKIFTQRCKDFTQRREVNILCVLCDVLCVFACNVFSAIIRLQFDVSRF